ncbi:MAG: PilZ domain-containing protein [Nitrospira sp.]|nr:PilZ domain-containing protein [bacterium]MBL7050431.1 PilZ domain-containing protein [Nitrospira sp.]
MANFIEDRRSSAKINIRGANHKRDVKFPLCLALRYGNQVPLECADFLLNTTTGKLFVETDNPLPVGSKVLLHFYIPPEIKLLSEVKGHVIGKRNLGSSSRGNYIKINDFLHRKLHRLEDYLSEKQHLVDKRI